MHPLFIYFNPDKTINFIIATTAMKKKFYTTPEFSVEEFKINQVICTSLHVGGGTLDGDVQPGDGHGPSTPRAKGREGIWDE